MIEYPNECLRGIQNESLLDEEGSPTAALFQFNNSRDDGFFEESVNWLDNDGAITKIMLQKKGDGSFQFKSGAAVLLKKEIDRIKKNQWVKDRLSYERSKIPDNEYHGNLLLKSDVPKILKRQISASIALTAVKEIIPNKYFTEK